MPGTWLRISLEVDPELAEAVSEVLARYIPGGVVIESTAVEPDAEHEDRAIGPLRVSGYIPTEDRDRVRSQIEEGLGYLSLIQPIPDPSYETIEEQNWMEAWKVHYRPLHIGQRLLILPAWMPHDPAGGPVAVRIDPGMAFGTGVHPTTQLSLQLLERYLKPGQSVIDVGCGSAILAIAAAKLGAGRVVAVDIDAQALDNARHNAQLNEVDIEIGVGSVAELLAGRFGLRQADLVVANILAPVLVRLLEQGLAKLMAESGVLILSGILAEQEGEMKRTLDQAGLKIIEERRIEDWLGLAAQK